MADLVYRRIDSADWPAIDRLTARVYGEPPGIDYWIRKHDKHPDEGGKPWGVSCFDGEKAVGFFSMLPLKLGIDGRVYPGNQIVDLMTDPDYRGQGIFDRMWSLLLEQMQDYHHCISIGFNVLGTAALKGHLKHGYVTLGQMIQHTKVYNLGRFCAGYRGLKLVRRAGFGLLAGGGVHRRRVTGHPCTSLPSNANMGTTHQRIMPTHSPAELEWRKNLNLPDDSGYFASNERWLQYVRHGDTLWLLSCGGKDCNHRVIAEIDYIASTASLTTARTYVSEYSTLRKALIRARWLPQGRERVLSYLRLSDALPDVSDWHDWHIMLGDTDNI
jgi:GNAT superfamily N-acetyltransferase